MNTERLHPRATSTFSRTFRYVMKNKALYLFLLPATIYYILFHYLPMYGVVIAFQDYNVAKGILGSKWVGWEHFERMFASRDFWPVLRNTVLISVYKILFYFPAPILLALLLNEVRHRTFKKVVQTVVYFPYFISWIVVFSLVYALTTTDGGLIPQIYRALGKEPVFFLSSKAHFRGLLVVTEIWKSAGWGTIIYLAAIAGINEEIYEAAVIDGANRLQQTRYITLPSILPTVITLFLLTVSNVLNAGFQQVLALYNASVYEVGDILDTFVYRQGLLSAQFSYATAVGIFKSVVSLCVVLMTDRIVKWFGHEGIF